MSRFAACFAILLLTAAVHAGEAPNTLSPKEIADGWLLLFDGATSFGWRTEGDVAVKDGWLRLGGDQAAKATFAIRFQYFELSAEFADVVREGGDIRLFSHTLTTAPPPKTVARFHLRFDPKGGFRGSLGFINDGRDISERFAVDTAPNVSVPMEISVPAKGRLAVRSIKLRPLETKAMLTGKDLTGWKQHPSKKASEWTVEDGILRVKNGPGDLQTESTWADFVMQAEIKTHGKALNSGIFFRAIPGDYQNGYEAQVQNAFKDGDRTKPVDFGTGAIYRRVPARKVVPDDNVWFTMTVAAQGKRIATWVNGYMTVDWTDDRPSDDNPRKGLRTAAGAISLQGHDPTTDISFRNLRIGDLAK